MRNPKWTRDELILALDLYFKIDASYIDSKNKDVIELSKILNNLPIHKKESKDDVFRNPTGVSMKLRNFQSIDPRYRSGLPNGARLDKVIWDEFENDRKRLQGIAKNIKDAVKYLNTIDENDTKNLDDSDDFPEGKVLY